jgi:hypothetical protein
MILLDLLAVLVVGIGTFLIIRIIDLCRPKRRRRTRRKQYVVPKRPSRVQIEGDLDRLLLLYNKGILNEEEYHYQANVLIDQLSDVLNAESALTH